MLAVKVLKDAVFVGESTKLAGCHNASAHGDGGVSQPGSCLPKCHNEVLKVCSDGRLEENIKQDNHPKQQKSNS